MTCVSLCNVVLSLLLITLPLHCKGRHLSEAIGPLITSLCSTHHCSICIYSIGNLAVLYGKWESWERCNIAIAHEYH